MVAKPETTKSFQVGQQTVIQRGKPTAFQSDQSGRSSHSVEFMFAGPSTKMSSRLGESIMLGVAIVLLGAATRLVTIPILV